MAEKQILYYRSMKQENYIGRLVSKYGKLAVERNMVFRYFVAKSMTYAQSSFFSDYFAGFVEDDELQEGLSQLGHKTLFELAYDMQFLIAVKDRKTNGVFFTPGYIVDYMISTLSPACGSCIIDPCCGCGAFLLGAADYMVRRYGKTYRRVITENVYGMDILPDNVFRSKLLLALLAYENGEMITLEDMKNIRCGNSLEARWSKSFDFVVGNPPYVRPQNMSAGTRNILHEKFSLSGNLYHTFYELAYRLLHEGGRLSYISPNDFLARGAGGTLRKFLETKLHAYIVVDFRDEMIFSAQVCTAIIFAEKGARADLRVAAIGQGVTPKQFLQNLCFSKIGEGEMDAHEWTLYDNRVKENLKKIKHAGVTLSSILDAKCGLSTGCNDVFVFSVHHEDAYYFYFMHEGSMNKVEKGVVLPVQKVSKVIRKNAGVRKKLRVIFPYRKVGRKYQSVTASEMSDVYPACYEYLAKHRGDLERVCRREDGVPFFAYGRRQSLDFVKDGFFFQSYARMPNFTMNTCTGSLFYNGKFLSLKPNAASLSELGNPDNIDVLQKVLNSCVMQYYIRHSSSYIPGGYYYYSIKTLKAFAFPCLTKKRCTSDSPVGWRRRHESFLVAQIRIG